MKMAIAAVACFTRGWRLTIGADSESRGPNRAVWIGPIRCEQHRVGLFYWSSPVPWVRPKKFDSRWPSVDHKRSRDGAETPNPTPKHVRRVNAERPAEIVSRFLRPIRPLVEATMSATASVLAFVNLKKRRRR